MNWFILFMIFVSSASATEFSKLIPIYLEAKDVYLKFNAREDEKYYLSPELLAALRVINKHKIKKGILENYGNKKISYWPLRDDDSYDAWLINQAEEATNVAVPEIAFQAFRFDVINPSDDFFKDDIYVYFFITDGVIPTGKVSSIYKGLGRDQGFFFDQKDRSIFPLTGIPAKIPDNHLIIDYGIIESDGDDIKEMQKISSLIIDLAIAVYSTYDPQNARVLVNLRKEVQALSEYLFSLNHDDRLVTDTIAFKASNLAKLLKERSYREFTKKHHSRAEFDTWEYNIGFRLIRN